jgi:hypothetical protein
MPPRIWAAFLHSHVECQVIAMIRAAIHLALHVVVPGAVAKTFYSKEFLRAWLVMLATMLVDLDHLLADPVYDPGRCSIGFHPLHQYPIIMLYGLLTLWSKTRVIGIGLFIHMLLDGLDCLWIQYEN